MSLTITQRPNQSGVWVAAKNPVIYKMTRKDFTWTTLVASGGNTSIQIATDVTASFASGDTIWLQSDNGSYSASGTVVSSAFGAATTVITTVPYVANNASGYINVLTQRANYYVSIGVYESPGGTFIGSVNYYPSKYGLLTINIKELLLSAIDASLPSGALTEGFISEISYQGFYIEYIEEWDGSSESIVNDVANISYGVFGANQIGQNGYVTTTNILTQFDSFKIVIGEFYTLSFIDTHSYASLFLIKTWYKQGVIYAASYTKTQSTAAQTLYTYCQALSDNSSISTTWIESLYPYINITNGGVTNWILLGNTGGAIANIPTVTLSKVGCALCYIPSGNTVQIKWTLSISGLGTPIAFLRTFDAAGSQVTNTGITGIVGLNQTGTVSITPGSDVRYVGIQIFNSSATNPIAVGYGATTGGSGPGLQLLVPNTSDRIDFIPVSVPAVVPFVQTTVTTNAITASITCSKNPITLFWRNSLGGESSWTFGYSQDQVQKLQDPYRNNWLTLYEQDLTLAQFNALNELITLGQVYQTPIIELTTSVDKTEARIDQQVYTVDSSGNKIGVIVIAGENKTRTRNKRHQFQVTIELPEVFG